MEQNNSRNPAPRRNRLADRGLTLSPHFLKYGDEATIRYKKLLSQDIQRHDAIREKLDYLEAMKLAGLTAGRRIDSVKFKAIDNEIKHLKKKAEDAVNSVLSMTDENYFGPGYRWDPEAGEAVNTRKLEGQAPSQKPLVSPLFQRGRLRRR